MILDRVTGFWGSECNGVAVSSLWAWADGRVGAEIEGVLAELGLLMQSRGFVVTRLGCAPIRCRSVRSHVGLVKCK